MRKISNELLFHLNIKFYLIINVNQNEFNETFRHYTLIYTLSTDIL